MTDRINIAGYGQTIMFDTRQEEAVKAAMPIVPFPGIILARDGGQRMLIDDVMESVVMAAIIQSAGEHNKNKSARAKLEQTVGRNSRELSGDAGMG